MVPHFPGKCFKHHTFSMAAKRKAMPPQLTASGPSTAEPTEGVGTGPEPVQRRLSKKQRVRPARRAQGTPAQGREKWNWSILGGFCLLR